MKKRIISMGLVLTLVFSMVAMGAVISVSYAAGTKNHNVTLIKGERMPVTYSDGTIKSVKTGNKSIVKTKKDAPNRFYLVAKGIGSAKITVSTTKGKHVYNVKVKESKLSVSQVSLVVKPSYLGTQYNSTIAFKVVNKSSIHISSATVSYTLQDTNGKQVEKGSFIVNCLNPGKAAYHSIDYAMKDTALKSSKAKISSWTRDPYYVCKDQSSKIDVNQVKDSGKLSAVEITNKANVNAAGNSDIIFRDNDGKIMYMESTSFYLTSGASTKYVLTYVPSNYAKVEIVARAASSKYKAI